MKKKNFWGKLKTAGKYIFSRQHGYNASKSTRRRARRQESTPRPEHLALDLSDRARVVGTLLDYRRNNPLVASICRLRETDVIGAGILPQLNSGNQGVDEELEGLWAEFSRSPEVSGSLSMRDLQRSIASMPLIFGDGGLILTKEGKVQIIEGDRIGTLEGQGFFNRENPKKVKPGSKRIIDGIELNNRNRAIAYHIGTRDDGFLRDIRRIKAENFLFHFKRIRPTQTRGIPELAPVADDLQDLDEYDEIEMISAKISATLSAVIKREGAMDFELNDRQDDEEDKLESFEPGRFQYLEPNEDISIISGNGRPNVSAIDYVTYRLRKIGSALGIPVEFLLQTIGETSFSASQGMILLYQSTIESEQRDICKVLDSLWRWKVRSWIAERKVKSSSEYDLMNIKWQPPGFRWVNRQAQVQSDATYLGLGAISLDDISATFGRDATTSLERKAKNIQQAKKIAQDHGIDDWQMLFNPFPTTAQANLLELMGREDGVDDAKE